MMDTVVFLHQTNDHVEQPSSPINAVLAIMGSSRALERTLIATARSALGSDTRRPPTTLR